MQPAVLLISSTRVHLDVQEILRLQDTAAAILEQGRAVDLLVPSVSPLLSAALAPAVKVFSVPGLPFCGDPPPRPSIRRFAVATLMFLRGFALAARRSYDALHGVNDGAIIARAVAAAAMRRRPFVAEFHLPFAAPMRHPGLRAAIGRAMERRAFRRAAAVVVPDEAILALFSARLPRARVSIIPDPHSEISPDAFTMGEFTNAVAHVYDYALRHEREG